MSYCFVLCYIYFFSLIQVINKVLFFFNILNLLNKYAFRICFFNIYNQSFVVNGTIPVFFSTTGITKTLNSSKHSFFLSRKGISPYLNNLHLKGHLNSAVTPSRCFCISLIKYFLCYNVFVIIICCTTM